ncbi:hypothetical protein BT69DRAFT_1332059 [Atractiella rhizophila]|nr:hypothetical protein BT69DRAFT_1332059 [Atractiella rhizophila]
MSSRTESTKSKQPLPRGSACTNCRKRKIACNGDPSGCDQCLKSQKVRQYASEPIVCTYTPGYSRSNSSSAGDAEDTKITGMEERIAILEMQLRQQEQLLRNINSSGSNDVALHYANQFTTEEISLMRTAGIIDASGNLLVDPKFFAQ